MLKMRQRDRVVKMSDLSPDGVMPRGFDPHRCQYTNVTGIFCFLSVRRFSSFPSPKIILHVVL